MNLYIIDGRKLKTQELVHDIFQTELKFPGWYGKNLDALWDMISSDDRWITLKLINVEDLLMELGDYGEKLIEVLEDSALTNSRFFFSKYQYGLFGK